MWDSDTSIEEEATYRRSQISEFIDSITIANASEWFEIIHRCAQTKSNDGATFPSFRRFLEELAREKPDFALQLIEQMDDDLAWFLSSILKGLDASIRRDEVSSLIGELLKEPRYLQQIAIFCGAVPTFDVDLLGRTIGEAIEHDDRVAVIWAMEVAARQNATSEEELVERVFLHGLKYLASVRDTRWVRAVWPFARKSAVFSSLSEASVDELLASLVGEMKLEHESEWVLAVIARNWPMKVLDYFIDRLRFANSSEAPKEFEPVPFSLSELREPLANFGADMVQKLRASHEDDARMFQYRGAGLLTAVFADFTLLENSLRSIIAEGKRRGIEFVLAVLRAFDGQRALHPACSDIVAALQPDDELLNEVAIVLDTTGMVSGQFGFVEAYQRKKVEMEGWLSDPRERGEDLCSKIHPELGTADSGEPASQRGGARVSKARVRGPIWQPGCSHATRRCRCLMPGSQLMAANCPRTKPFHTASKR
jgi:hypothetical protein